MPEISSTSQAAASHSIETQRRFEFGANWARFLAVLDDARIAQAEASLQEMLGVERLDGRTFLDIGCGSGLFSLVARRLGATVHSFDFDAQSVACALELRRRYFHDDAAWRIEQGSVLDRPYLGTLGEFDVVYSWGVLHHTGAMWLALENAISRVRTPDGMLFIAIYNDQGWKSHLWWFIKATYNRLPRMLRLPFAKTTMFLVRIGSLIKYTLLLRPRGAFASLFGSRRVRGMSLKHDDVDWIGGFPYEFASLETLQAYLSSRGFAVVSSRPGSSLGCNEIVVRRN